jgi:hypothetical protein
MQQKDDSFTYTMALREVDCRLSPQPPDDECQELHLPWNIPKLVANSMPGLYLIASAGPVRKAWDHLYNMFRAIRQLSRESPRPCAEISRTILGQIKCESRGPIEATWARQSRFVPPVDSTIL